jgi:formylglycine-generating enzyme required for sulfatase activity
LLDYRERVDAWRRFIDELPDNNRVVFTCRSLDYSEPLGLPQVEISHLDDGRVKDFLRLYLRDAKPPLADEAWNRLQGSALLELVRNPWYLTMLAWVLGKGGGWPESRAGLFKGFVGALLIRESERGHPDWPGEEVLHKALAVLAEAMQPLGEGTQLPYVAVLKTLPETVDTRDGPVATPPTVTLRLAQAATLLDTTEPGEGGGKIRFYHHQLQEYFAAKALLVRFEQGDDLTKYWHQPKLEAEMPDPGPLGDTEPLPPPPTTGWGEPTVLAAGLAGDSSGAFLEAVEQVNPVLASRCLREPGLAHAKDRRETIQRALGEMMTSSKNHLRARLAAGDELGRLGDPRFKAICVNGARVSLPPLVEIPGGSFRMGSSWWEEKFGDAYSNERPRHTVTLPSFQIGKYPVTNAEFECFMTDDGYRQERWWRSENARAWLRDSRSDGAWPAHRLEILNDERFNNPSQPVVLVTWFEAMAYCRWLTERWSEAGGNISKLLLSGATVRLPTEAEWEWVARFSAENAYPWGPNWDSSRANTYEGRVLRPSPVGVYPRGANGLGVEDLAGNVWEWTSSLWQDYPTRPGDNRNDPDAAGPRVLRGGSWNFDFRGLVRGASRGSYHPDGWDLIQGFRLVLSLADSEF